MLKTGRPGAAIVAGKGPAEGFSATGDKKRQAGQTALAKEAMRNNALSESRAERASEGAAKNLTDLLVKAHAPILGKRPAGTNLEEKSRFEADVTRELMALSLSETWIAALELHEKYKEQRGEALSREGLRFFDEMLKEDSAMIAVAESDSTFIESLFEAAEVEAKELTEKFFAEGKESFVEALSKSADRMKAIVKESSAPAVDAIRGNIKLVVDRERKVNSELKPLLEEYEQSVKDGKNHGFVEKRIRELNKPTLFGSVVQLVMEDVINRRGAKDGNVDMDEVFTESVCHYAALETLNALKILPVNRTKLEETVQVYSLRRLKVPAPAK
jgi:hypothetical protein